MQPESVDAESKGRGRMAPSKRHRALIRESQRQISGQDVSIGNTFHLQAQLDQKLQLDYKTNISQICQKIELYGSPITKDLKKPHSSRRVGGLERQRGAEREEQQRSIDTWSGLERRWNGWSHHGNSKALPHAIYRYLFYNRPHY